MKLRKFQAANMRDAVAQVKAELGPEAMIVTTRQVRRGFLGSGVEVTAAVDIDEDQIPGEDSVPTAAPVPRIEVTADLERLIGPIRAELRAIRFQLRPSGDTGEIKRELHAMRQALFGFRDARVELEGSEKGRLEQLATRQIAAPSKRRVVAVVGPTGVGKTTTIAKLAARDALIAGRSVAIVSIDTYRVGGEEQMRIFAELIGVPLVVVRDLGDLGPTLSRLDSYDRVFIDTAGRSPRDGAALSAMVQALLTIEDLEVHLTVAAGTPEAAIDAWVHRYGVTNIDRLLFTKVDEAEDLTQLVEAPARLRRPVSYITTGQRVPEDIESATAERLLELATRGLGEEREAA